MRSFLALVRKELKGYFDQPTGYIILFIFVGILSWFFFQQALQNKEASMRPLFDLLPFALAIFIPASTMRLIAEELRDGTLEILLTQPIRGWTVLFAKFVAGLVFVTVGIVLTLGMPLLVETAGDLDGGATAAQYIGSVFLAAAFVSIGLFTSSLTQNQIVAFILALFFNTVLILIGVELVTLTLPPAVSVLLVDLSPITHFSSMARGVLALSDALYFLALVSLFLSATYLAIRGRTVSHRTPQYNNLRVGVAGLVIASLLVGWFGSSIGGRWDLTEDQLFTLSPTTHEILDGLDDLLTVNLYASKDPPVQVALTSRDVNDFLDGLASKSDKVRVVHKFPDQDEEIALEAQQAGVPALRFNIRSEGELQVTTGWLGMTMTYADRREVIQYIPSVDGLEYRVASMAFNMVQEERKTIGFLAGHGEKLMDVDLTLLAAVLRAQYHLKQVEAGPEEPLDLSDIDVLIVPGPTENVSDGDQDALHNYLALGGKAMILVDTTQLDSNRWVVETSPDNFSDFPHRYGVFVHDNIVLDLDSNEPVSVNTGAGGILLPYPYWARVSTVENKISGEVESVVLAWTASLELTDPQVDGVATLIPLLRTSPSGVLQFDYRDVIPREPGVEEYGVDPQDFGRQLVGVAVESQPLANPEDGRADSFRLIVVGDSEWLTDIMINSIRSDTNLVVALNWIDWLAQEEALAQIRSKVVSTRQLLFSSDTHRNLVQYGNMVGVPVLLVVVGVLRFIIRRNLSRRTYGREG